MSEREEVRVITSESKKEIPLVSEKHGVLSTEQLLKLADDQIAQRFVDIADRGLVNLRLNVPLPPDVHGEWVPYDPASIAEYRIKGFEVDDKYATQYGLHSDGSGKPIIGDVIFMTCPKRIKEAHDAAARIRFERTHGRSHNLPEETQFEETVKKMGLDTKFKGTDINTSSQEKVDASKIRSTIMGTKQ